MDLKEIIGLEEILDLFICSLLILWYILSTMKVTLWIQTGVLILIFFLLGIQVGYKLTKGNLL